MMLRAMPGAQKMQEATCITSCMGKTQKSSDFVLRIATG
jgi:hypothetical protein